MVCKKNNLIEVLKNDETAFLLSNPNNKAFLLKSIEEDKNGESITITIKEDEIKD